MKLLLTRPETDSVEITGILKDLGHEVLSNPLLEITFSDEGAKDLKKLGFEGFDGLIFTSANGVRAFCHFFERRDFTVYAVGAATSKTAQDQGFKDIKSADGDVESLAQLIHFQAKSKSNFLHIAANHLAGDLAGLLEKNGFGYSRAVLYQSHKRGELQPDVIEAFKKSEIQGVLLYSPRTAESFAQIIEKAKLQSHIKNVVAYGLSEAVAAKIKNLEWKDIKVASTPNQDALIDLLNAGKEPKMTDPKDDPKSSKIPSVDKTDKPEDKKPAETKAETKPKPKADGKTQAKPADKKPIDAKDQPKAAVKPKKKGSWKLKAAMFLIIVIGASGGAAYYLQDMWVPQVKKKVVDVLGLETVMTPTAPAMDMAIIEELQSRLAAVEGREIPTVEMPEPINIAPLVEQINTLENQVSSIKLSAGDDEALAIIEEVIAKVEGLSAPDLDGMIPDIAPIVEENAALKVQVEELIARIVTLEEERFAQRSATDEAQALVAALSTLRQSLMTSDAYGPELSVMVRLAEKDMELAGLAEKLAPHAEGGIKSFSALVSTFDRMADDVVRAAAIPEGTHWMEETVKNLTTLVRIRRAPDQIDGEGPLGIVARAEYNLQNGDLAQTLEELSLLEGKPLEAAADWVMQAEARLMAEETLAALQARILAKMNGAEG